MRYDQRCSWDGWVEPTLCVGTNSPARPPDNIWIYNNTAYRGDSGSEFSVVKIDTTSTNVTVQNNLAYAPLSTSTMIVKVLGHRVWFSQTTLPTLKLKALFRAGSLSPPQHPQISALTAGSYARRPVRRPGGLVDFFRTSRPQNGVIDMGAVERALDWSFLDDDLRIRLY